MKKAKKLAQKKAALSTVLTVLALCGTLSVSAADPVTMDLTSGTDHPNKVSSSSTTADTVAIGFDNKVYNGALVIGDDNYAINTNSTAVGRNNNANNGSVAVGYNNKALAGSTVIGQNGYGTSWATLVGKDSRSAGAVVMGREASGGIFNIDLTTKNDPTLSYTSTAIGNFSSALVGTSLGANTKSDHGGVAVGAGANAMYGGTAIGKGASTAESTYSYLRADGVALGDSSYATRGYGIYGYVPLKDTTDIVKNVYATTAATDSMANDMALANKTGDASVVSAVTNFYNQYGEDVYNDYKTIESAYEKAVMAYDKQAAKMNSTTYATEADRASDLATLTSLSDGKKAAIAALKAFENEHTGIAAAVLRKDSALSTYKATAAAVSLGYGTADSNEAVTRQITNLAAGTADTDAVNVAQLKQVATIANNHTAITVDGKAPTAGENGELGDYVGDNNLTMAVKDVDGQKTYDLKLSNSLVIGEKGADGADGTDGTPGSIGIVGPKGADGKNAYADISVKDGANGLNGENITRIVYTDEDGTEHQVATLDDGLKFTGDTANVTVAKKLNETLPITGGADMTRLSDNNIGVVADAASGLTVKLAKDLNLADGSITLIGAKDADDNTLVQGQDGKWYSDLSDATYDATSGTYIKTDGTTVTAVDSPTTSTVNLSGSGLDNGGQTITNVAAGVKDTDAVNKGQLTKAISDATASVNGKHTTITVDGTEAKAGEYVGTGNLKLGLTETDGQKTYDLKLSNNVTIGEKGADGADGTPGSIGIVGPKGADGKNAYADLTVKDGANGLDGESLTRIVYTDEDGNEHQVATLDDGLKFSGDTGSVAKKLNETLSITGGADMTNLSDKNIGVVADANGGLTVKLSKDLTGINSITGLSNTTWDANNIVSGRAATEDQLQAVASGITNTVNANKVIAGDNISVSQNADGSGTTVSLKNDITLGDKTDAAKQVNINGDAATVTAGSDTNQVVVDGSKGQITTGSGITLGNQTVDAAKADGTVVKSETGSYLTGLDNTTWNPDTNGYVADRAATEGQLKNVSDTIKNISDTISVIGTGTRDFAGDDSTNKVSVKLGETMNLTGGADVNNLSDNNIGVVANSAKNGFDIKLSKDLTGLNSVTTKELNSETANITNSITVGTGDNKTVITGDSIHTGNTTINNNGLTVTNSDSTKNITIQDGSVNMGGNVIHNVGDAQSASDAINKGQFDRTIDNIGNGMNEMNGRINQIGRDVNRVGAGAAALASLHPLDYDPDDKGSFAVGFGSYKSEHAAAVGAFYRPNEDTMVNFAATVGNNDNMYSAGVSFKIGSSSPYAHMSKSEMAVKLESQDKQLTDQNQKIETLESQNQDLNARLAKLEALIASK